MIAFLVATTFSALLSYGLSYYINMQRLVKQIKEDEISIATYVTWIADNTQIDVAVAADRYSSSMYVMSVLTQKQIDRISDENMELIEAGEIVTVSKFMRFDTQCMFKAGDYIISVRLNPKSEVVKLYGDRLGTILILMLLFSAVLMFFLSKSVTKPLKELNAATKKVAKGDFDVQVNVTNDTEVAQLARSFNRMVNELKSNELLKKDFISNVSHEFKTPLATINGFAKLLLDGNCSAEEVSEYAGIIDHETSRLSTLCSNILKLSRIENEKIIVKPAEFLLDEQLRDVLVMLEPQWTAKNLELDVDLDEIKYYGDEELLQQVWINLISNAIKFTDNGGRISVLCTNTPSEIIVTVADTGIGMTEDTQKHIFEKFYQSDSTRATDGNGLGLALVKEILALCNGKIRVKSNLGEGSCFTVTLPKVETDE